MSIRDTGGVASGHDLEATAGRLVRLIAARQPLAHKLRPGGRVGVLVGNQTDIPLDPRLTGRRIGRDIPHCGAERSTRIIGRSDREH
eukprot:8064737-Alexandrium_andersonii.AAC.1